MKKLVNYLCITASTVALISLLMSWAAGQSSGWEFESWLALIGSVLIFVAVNAPGWREL